MAVCDAGGRPLLVRRMDGAMPASAAIASSKARSAVLFARETKLLEASANLNSSSTGAGRAALLSSGECLMEGGVPVRDSGGVIIGAVGVSGAKPQEDQVCAQAAVAELGAVVKSKL